MHGRNISVQAMTWTQCASGSAALTVGVWMSSVLPQSSAWSLFSVPWSSAGSLSQLPWSSARSFSVALVYARCMPVCHVMESLSSAWQARGSPIAGRACNAMCNK